MCTINPDVQPERRCAGLANPLDISRKRNIFIPNKKTDRKNTTEVRAI